MKRCPTCNRSYFDEGLNFCLDDGARLTVSTADPTKHYAPRSSDPLVTDVLPGGHATPNIHESGRLAQADQNSLPKYHALAITSFVLGLIPCTCIPSILAVIFGHIALARMKAAPDLYRGRALALWGVGLGYFFTVCNIIYGIVMTVVNPR